MIAHSFFERLASSTPLVKLSLSAYAHLIKFWEVDVMQAKSARQFPDAFNRIELRTIWRQKVEPKPRVDLLSPGLMQERVMILRVIENNDYSVSASKTLAVQLLQKLPTAVYNRLDDLPAPDREILTPVSSEINRRHCPSFAISSLRFSCHSGS